MQWQEILLVYVLSTSISPAPRVWMHSIPLLKNKSWLPISNFLISHHSLWGEWSGHIPGSWQSHWFPFCSSNMPSFFLFMALEPVVPSFWNVLVPVCLLPQNPGLAGPFCHSSLSSYHLTSPLPILKLLHNHSPSYYQSPDLGWNHLGYFEFTPVNPARMYSISLECVGPYCSPRTSNNAWFPVGSWVIQFI